MGLGFLKLTFPGRERQARFQIHALGMSMYKFLFLACRAKDVSSTNEDMMMSLTSFKLVKSISVSLILISLFTESADSVRGCRESLHQVSSVTAFS